MKQTITAYPVPAKNFVYLHLENDRPQDEKLLQIIDFTGKIAYSKISVQNQNNIEKIDISNRPAGIYFAYIHSNGQKLLKHKLIVYH